MLRALAGASVLAAVLASSPARADEPTDARTQGPPPPPKELTLEDGLRVPAGSTVVERTRRGPIVAGAIMLGSSYLLAAAVAGIDAAYGYSSPALFVPVLGPFVQMGGSADIGSLILVTNGLVQGAGLGLLLYGLVAKKSVLMRDDLVVAPMVTGSASGLVVAGRF